MPPTTISSAPPLESFTLLAEHQSQTPSSFYGSKPVLHYHAVEARALAPRDQISRLPFFTRQEDGEAAGGDGEAAEMKAEVVDAFISSEYVQHCPDCTTFYNKCLWELNRADYTCSETSRSSTTVPLLVSQFHTLPSPSTQFRDYPILRTPPRNYKDYICNSTSPIRMQWLKMTNLRR